MKKILYIFIALAIVASCSSKDKAKVALTLPDAADSTEIVVTKLVLNKINVVDTLYVQGNKLNFEAACVPGAPDFYYFYHKDNKIGSLVLQSGDNIGATLSIKDGISDITGSDESVKYAQIDKENDRIAREVISLVVEITKAQEAEDEAKAKSLSQELSKLYVKHKQNSIKYIYSNSKSITVIPVMYQRLSADLPLFGDINDVFIFKSIYDSLKLSYPNSPYLISLSDDIRQRTSTIELEQKLQTIGETNFPDISLFDSNAKARTLSELTGKVIILSFWSVTEPTHKIFNAELKEIYDKYKGKGLEVYQICIDADKTAWARQVKDQGLEWVSVCDPGNISGSMNLYNVQKVPAMYIIDKNGDIVDKDLFELDKLERRIAKLVR